MNPQNPPELGMLSPYLRPDRVVVAQKEDLGRNDPELRSLNNEGSFVFIQTPLLLSLFVRQLPGKIIQDDCRGTGFFR